MQKVVRRVINHKYTTLKSDMLIEGAVVNFDCYIKRFNNYVIIIEAGTLITAELAVKLKRIEKIYIAVQDTDKIRGYIERYGLKEKNAVPNPIRSVQEMIPSVMRLNEILQQCETFENQLQSVYQTTSELMEAIFYESSETLPLSALDACVDALVHCLNRDESDAISIILRIIPEAYTTHHHSTNVAIFSIILGRSTGLTKESLREVAYAGLLHDIGKMRIDQSLLLKPTYLETKEVERMQQHSNFGLEILQNNGIADPKILDAVHYHHEKLDGNGYPSRLRGKMIPKFARIIGMCDVFDALTTQRTFRSNYTSYEALIMIKQQMADQFDEYYTDTFIRLLGSPRKGK
ncbi:HD-GYP domain-containing protein [Sulfuricurvum sp.]|uniref:HD-GYP domain-containing protein n=1 Tax=Sulfuricurvum sp. TaxID=2025608 RepID=UPI003C6AB6BF